MLIGGDVLMNDNIVFIKRRTLELYDQLPIDDAEARESRTDIRDELLGMHTNLFRRIAHNTYLDHNRYDYEDKFQEVCLQFAQIWWWYQWPPRFKTQASFSSYFFIRLKERAERALNELSYSVYRSTLIECQELLGLDHWTKVKPEMLTNIKGNVETVQLAMRLFNRNFYTPLDAHYDLQSTSSSLVSGVLESYCENPSDVRRLLISEMIYRESQLDSAELQEISTVYSLSLKELQENLESARSELYRELKQASAVDDSFNN